MREGYHWLPVGQRAERDKKIIILYDSSLPVKNIAERMSLSYEGARRILRKAGRMGRP